MDDFSFFVNELKQKVNIVQVIDRYVKVNKKGGRYVALCPFHSDRNPSMTVSPQMGIFKCFVCGQGGDVIRFLQEYEKISFMDAIRQLSNQAGMVIPEFKKGTNQKQNSQSSTFRKVFLEMYAQAIEHYKRNLNQSPEAQQYLKDRQISLELATKFSLGYSISSWTQMTELLKKKYTEPQMLKSGLVKKNASNSLRDAFVGRIMFPIFDLSHQAIGFGGRVLDAEQKTAKYINSAESEIYHKSSILYGFNLARKSIQENGKVLLVEGYMDVLRMHQMGFENVVAVSGTALTVEHAEMLVRFAQEVYLFFDGDGAGLNAVEKSLPLLLEKGLEVRIPYLPKHQDPDSYALEYGKEGIEKLLNQSDHVLDFLLREFRANPNNYTNEKKGLLFEKVKKILHTIASDFVRREYLQDLEKIRKEFFQGRSILPKSSLSSKLSLKNNSKEEKFEQLKNRLAVKMKQSPEWKILTYVISHPRLFLELFQKNNFDTLWIQDSFLQEILDRLMVECDQLRQVNLAMAQEALPRKYKDLLCLMEPFEVETSVDLKIAQKALFQIFNSVQLQFLKKQIEKIDQDKDQLHLKQEQWLERRLKLQKEMKELAYKRVNL